MKEFQKNNLLHLFYYKDYGEKEFDRILKHQKYLIKGYSQNPKPKHTIELKQEI